MPKLLHQLPAYRRHKASGQAVVTLNGRTFYLGPWKSASSKREYHRLTSQYLAAGGTLADSDKADELTIVELLAAFWKHAKGHYLDSTGEPTSERASYKTLIGRLRKAYGDILARDFGPLKLKAFRQMLVDEGLSRNVINRSVCRVRLMFKWGAENELVSTGVVEALRCVAGLRYGKCAAQESDPVKPVPDAFVDAVLTYVAPQVRAMLEFRDAFGRSLPVAGSGHIHWRQRLDLHTGPAQDDVPRSFPRGLSRTPSSGDYAPLAADGPGKPSLLPGGSGSQPAAAATPGPQDASDLWESSGNESQEQAAEIRRQRLHDKQLSPCPQIRH